MSKYHITKDGKKAKKGLWYYMNKRKKSGTSRPGKGTVSDEAIEKSQKKTGGAWTRKEGKNPEGGLNAKGRASLKAQGQDIKAPVTEDKPSGKRKKNIGHHAIGTRHQTSGIRHQASGTRHQASSIKHQALETHLHQASGIRHQASGMRHQASETHWHEA